MTRRAVVFYATDASDEDKIRALRAGISDCAGELAELGQDLEIIRETLDSAMDFAEWVIECARTE